MLFDYCWLLYNTLKWHQLIRQTVTMRLTAVPRTKTQLVTMIADCCFSNNRKTPQTTAHVIRVPIIALPAKAVIIPVTLAPDANLPRALLAPKRSASIISMVLECMSGFIRCAFVESATWLFYEAAYSLIRVVFIFIVVSLYDLP